jgi:hypothetical protein
VAYNAGEGMASKGTSDWKNRIVKSEMVSPEKLIPNPQNWRKHPKQQQRVMDDVLKEVGWIQNVVVNETTGRIIDGHLRVELALEKGEKEVPVTYVKLTEEEEKKALATFDPISGMALTDAELFTALAGETTTDSLYIRELLKNTQLEGEAEDEEGEELDAEAVKEFDRPEMELQPFEHYDYIMLCFRNDQDFSRACELLEIKRVKWPIPGSDKVKIGLGRVVDGAKALKKLCK